LPGWLFCINQLPHSGYENQQYAVATGLSASAVTRMEMVGLLCVMDRTHSQLVDAIPETCGVSHHDKDYESVIQQVSA